METYIIRIYRRDAEDQRKIVGITELVKTQEKKAFHGFDELLLILSPPEPGRRKKKASSRYQENDLAKNP